MTKKEKGITKLMACRFKGHHIVSYGIGDGNQKFICFTCLEKRHNHFTCGCIEQHLHSQKGFK